MPIKGIYSFIEKRRRGNAGFSYILPNWRLHARTGSSICGGFSVNAGRLYILPVKGSENNGKHFNISSFNGNILIICFGKFGFWKADVYVLG